MAESIWSTYKPKNLQEFNCAAASNRHSYSSGGSRNVPFSTWFKGYHLPGGCASNVRSIGTAVRILTPRHKAKDRVLTNAMYPLMKFWCDTHRPKASL